MKPINYSKVLKTFDAGSEQTYTCTEDCCLIGNFMPAANTNSAVTINGNVVGNGNAGNLGLVFPWFNLPLRKGDIVKVPAQNTTNFSNRKLCIFAYA